MSHLFTQQDIDCTQYEDVTTIGDDLKALRNATTEIAADLVALKELSKDMKDCIHRLEQRMIVTARREDEVMVPEVRENIAQPFVTITDDVDEKHDLYLPKSTLNQLLAATVEREAVRILLLHFYDIKILQGFTLTGKTRSNFRASEGSVSIETQMFPPHRVKLIQAAILRLFPVSEKVRNADRKEYDDSINRKKKDVKASVTALLQYFKNQYDTEGKRKSQPTTPESRNKSKRLRDGSQIINEKDN